MPGGIRWNPSKEPFSYTKLCYYYFPGLLCFLFVTALLLSAFVEVPWLDELGTWLTSSPLRIALTVLLIGPGYDFISMKILWKVLPSSVRERVPYDSKEAMELKGDIRSFWDLRKLMLPVPSKLNSR